MWRVLEVAHGALGGDELVRDMLIGKGMSPDRVEAVLERLAFRRRSLET